MLFQYQVSFTISLEVSGQVLGWFAERGTIADLSATVLPDDIVRYDFAWLTWQS